MTRRDELAARREARAAATAERVRVANESVLSVCEVPRRRIEIADAIGSDHVSVWFRIQALRDEGRLRLVDDGETIGWLAVEDDPSMGPWSLERVQAELSWRAGC